MWNRCLLSRRGFARNRRSVITRYAADEGFYGGVRNLKERNERMKLDVMESVLTVPEAAEILEVTPQRVRFFPDFAGFGEQTIASTGFSFFTSHYNGSSPALKGKKL